MAEDLAARIAAFLEERLKSNPRDSLTDFVQVFPDASAEELDRGVAIYDELRAADLAEAQSC